VAVECDESCFCRQIGNTGAWVIKENLEFDDFLDHYANLWAQGSSSLIGKVKDSKQSPSHREMYSVPVLRALKERWTDWDGHGNSLPNLANQIRYTFLCDDGFNQIDSIVKVARTLCTDNTGVYTSKMISQIFPEIVIPFDTASKSIMRRCGYEPTLYGAGILKKEVIDFINHNRLSASDFRSFDNAPLNDWGQFPRPNGEITSFSRVIDKLFYSQE